MYVNVWEDNEHNQRRKGKRKEMLKEKKTPTKKKKITEKSVIVWTKRCRTKYDEYLGSIACYVSKKGKVVRPIYIVRYIVYTLTIYSYTK